MKNLSFLSSLGKRRGKKKKKKKKKESVFTRKFCQLQ